MNIRLAKKHTRDEKKIEFQMPNMLLGITFILSLIHNIRNLIYDGMSRILLMRADLPREFMFPLFLSSAPSENIFFFAHILEGFFYWNPRETTANVFVMKTRHIKLNFNVRTRSFVYIPCASRIHPNKLNHRFLSRKKKFKGQHPKVLIMEEDCVLSLPRISKDPLKCAKTKTSRFLLNFCL